MENNKQTAVEWLVEQFDLTSDSPIIKNIVNQAKAMEKQQIMDAFDEGYFDEKSAQQYYKQEFGDET